MATGDMLGLLFLLIPHTQETTGFTEQTMNTNAVCHISNKEIWQDKKH